MNAHVETFSYDDAIVRKFLWATIIWGHSSLNLALLTGESRPEHAHVGDRVFAGTVNLSATLRVVFVGAWVWSTRSGQYDDLETPAIRALQDEPTKRR